MTVRGVRPTLVVLLVLIGARVCDAQVFVDTPEVPVTAPEDVVTGLRYFVADQVTFDDNLFRLPEGYQNLQNGAFAVKRSDRSNGVSVGATDNWISDLQSVAFNFRLNHDDYENNSYLNNSSGSGSVLWNWSLAHYWSGQLSASYSRGLVSFANQRLFDKDLVDNGGYSGSARYQLGPNWALTFAAQQTDTRHSLNEERSQDTHVTAGEVGIEREFSIDSTVEIQYKYDTATFPDNVPVAGSQGDFHDSIARVLVLYEPSDKTVIAANGGHLERTYANDSLSEFSGNVWHGSFKWQPREKTVITLLASRDLTAYSSAASEYFVDQARGVNLAWTPRQTLSVGVLLNWDSQNYIPGAGTVLDTVQRKDRVRAQKFSATYAPRDWLSFDMYLRWEQRNSNDPTFTYSDRQVSAAFRITL